MSEAINLNHAFRSLRIGAREVIVSLVVHNGAEGMLTNQVAEILNISENAIQKHIRNYALSAGVMLPHIMRTLKDQNIIPIKSKQATFLPRETIKALVKIVGTPEAWAIYEQLWDDAKELAEIKPKLAAMEDAVAKLQSDNLTLMKRNQELEMATSEMKQQIEEASAKLQAAIDHLEHKGKGKRRVRHSLVDIEFAGVNIFEGPQYRVTIKKLEMSEMSSREKEAFSIQRGIASICGIAESMQGRAARMDVSNKDIMEALRDLSAASDAAYHKLIPGAGRVFGLSDGQGIGFVN